MENIASITDLLFDIYAVFVDPKHYDQRTNNSTMRRTSYFKLIGDKYEITMPISDDCEIYKYRYSITGEYGMYFSVSAQMPYGHEIRSHLLIDSDYIPDSEFKKVVGSNNCINFQASIIHIVDNCISDVEVHFTHSKSTIISKIKFSLDKKIGDEWFINYNKMKSQLKLF